MFINVQRFVIEASDGVMIIIIDLSLLRNLSDFSKGHQKQANKANCWKPIGYTVEQLIPFQASNRADVPLDIKTP
ncbi:hypothetical protein CEXT_472221 [Caerostris extrusa]|uniref:Uncharacterized protein n=1 Tax=Caerostris extrusa TaxID=172846 RepID=A0AAV4W5M0_CAEEX|nr:hypothetical protein CEXT_472221 [Caerostris extrusa]